MSKNRYRVGNGVSLRISCLKQLATLNLNTRVRVVSLILAHSNDSAVDPSVVFAPPFPDFKGRFVICDLTFSLGASPPPPSSLVGLRVNPFHPQANFKPTSLCHFFDNSGADIFDDD